MIFLKAGFPVTFLEGGVRRGGQLDHRVYREWWFSTWMNIILL